MHFFNRKMAEGRCKIAYWQVSFGNIFQLWSVDLKPTLWIYCALQNIISPMYFDHKSVGWGGERVTEQSRKRLVTKVVMEM